MAESNCRQSYGTYGYMETRLYGFKVVSVQLMHSHDVIWVLSSVRPSLRADYLDVY